MNKNTKIIIGIIVIIVVVWIGYSVSKKSTEQNTVKIGAILPITGPMAFLGEEVRDAISLAAEDINSEGDFKLEVVIEDSKLDPKEGVAAINKLKNIDGIKNVIVWGTPVISAVQPITEKNEMVMMAGSISPSVLKNTSYTFRLFYNLEQALDKFSDFINKKGYSKVAVLYQNGEAWENQVLGLETRNIVLAAKEKFNSGEKDFRTQLFKIKNQKPEVLIILGYGSSLPIILKQVKEVSLNSLILGGLDFAEIPKDSDLSLFDNSVFVVPDFTLYTNEKSASFKDKFKTKFGFTPSHQAGYAYDSVKILSNAIYGAKGNVSEVVSLIKNNQILNKTVGNIEILSNGDTRSNLSWAIYKNGIMSSYDF